jgi:hypothetical protein
VCGHGVRGRDDGERTPVGREPRLQPAALASMHFAGDHRVGGVGRGHAAGVHRHVCCDGQVLWPPWGRLPVAATTHPRQLHCRRPLTAILSEGICCIHSLYFQACLYVM